MNLSAINCTDPPIDIESNGLAFRNWTEEEGNPRPYATKIVYQCTREGIILIFLKKHMNIFKRLTYPHQIIVINVLN